MWLDVDLDVEIARCSWRCRQLSLSSEAQAMSGVHAGWNLQPDRESKLRVVGPVEVYFTPACGVDELQLNDACPVTR